jgi:hypothetical protein
LPGHGNAVSTTLTDILNTTLTVTSGNQTVTCPTVTWEAVFTWAKKGKPKGTPTVTNVGNVDWSMNNLRPGLIAVAASVSLFALDALLPTANVMGQSQAPSAADLIARLGNQSRERFRDPSFTCGQLLAIAADSRQTAELLAESGSSASPEIEEALDSIEKEAQGSRFAPGGEWLLYAYAKIKGSDAYPLLRKMAGEPELQFLHYALDTSVALALGLTSYVDGSRIPSEGICRSEVPRDALNDLILAWERDDRERFEARLGQSAKGALKSLLKGRTWTRMRSDLWRKNGGRDAAVGYRFDTTERWSEPDETLEPEAPQSPDPDVAEIPTLFRSGASTVCGVYQVKFYRTQDKGAVLRKYVVDNPDIEGLLNLITVCATKTSKGQ